jgi:hypothetical protein
LLAVGGGHGSVKIYDARNNFVLIDSIDYSTTITGDKIEESSIKDYVLNLSWTKDGKRLLLSDREGSITFYYASLFRNLNDADLIEVAHLLEKRSLTENEIDKYLSQE